MELTDLEKLDQLVEMMVDWDPWWSKHHANSRDEENPFEEFKDILNSLPVDLVFIVMLRLTENKKQDGKIDPLGQFATMLYATFVELSETLFWISLNTCFVLSSYLS